MKNFFTGLFALGLVVGLCLAVFVHYYLINSCPADNSTLWLCNEPQEIVLRVLEVIETTIVAAMWPVALICLAIYYRNEIRTLLARDIKVGGGHFELSTPVSQGASRNVQSAKLSSFKLDPLLDPTAAGIEAGFEKDLEAIGDSDERIRVLLRALTIERMNTSFAVAYSSMFGSQILALENLNGKNISKTEAEASFKEIQKTDPLFVDWTLGQYTNYLIAWKFVEYDDNIYSITATGRGFLLFLTSNGLSKDRLH